MRCVVLSAAPQADPSLSALAFTLRQELERAGYADPVWFDLSAHKLAYCQGEFDCWVVSPGRCRSEDVEQEIVAAIHDAEALVLLGPVTFGGHGYTQKRAVDRLICLLSPFFEKRVHLTHHGHRYDKPASLFVLGWQREPDAAQAQTFADLADANGLNFMAPRVGVAVVDDSSAPSWPSAVSAMLSSTAVPGASIHTRSQLTRALADSARPSPLSPLSPPSKPARAALLVGSAKKKGTSVSEQLARSLGKRLEAAGVVTELHFATEFVREGEPAVNAARAIATADLFVMAAPLYVDSLPALCTHALELVARERATDAQPAGFAAILNCGFPEAEQNRTALCIARHFADSAGYRYLGGLPLGGGGAIAGRSLENAGGPALHVANALDLAAPALAAGHPLPEAAFNAMATAPMPDAVYRILGDLGWRALAYQHGLAQSDLHARPLDES